MPSFDSTADLILSRGRIYTVDPEDHVVEAVAIKDGHIMAFGPAEDVGRLAGPRTRRVDLEGRAVVPGFVDGHPHMEGSACASSAHPSTTLARRCSERPAA